MKLIYKNGAKLKTITLIICILLFAVSFSTAGSTVINRGIEDKIRTNKLVYKINFPEPQLQEKKIHNQIFTEIIMPGTIPVGEPGKPVYPTAPLNVLIPQGEKVGRVNVKTNVKKTVTSIDLKQKPVMPFQRSKPINEPQLDFGMSKTAVKSKGPASSIGIIKKEKSVNFEIDKEAYNYDINSPGKLYDTLDVTYSHGYQILSVNINPTEYNPKKGELSYYSEIILELELEKTGYVNQFYRDNPDDEAWVKKLIMNPEVTETYTSFESNYYEGGLCDPADNSGLGYDYVIITREALSDFTGTKYTWDDLIKRKQMDGLEATKVTVEDILACPDYWNTTTPYPELFNDTAYLIREFCRDAYIDWDTQYVLIGGDQDGENYIPRRLMIAFYENEIIESDLYWSNLDNTFNADNDNEWGEYYDGGFDPFSELFIGSIPCDEPIDVSNWLTKSFCYEDLVDSDYLDNAAFYADDSGWLVESDDMIDYSAIKGTDYWLGPNPSGGGIYPSFLGFQHGFETWNDEYPDMEFNLSVKWTDEPPNPGWQGGSKKVAVEGMRDAINSDQVTLISCVGHAFAYQSMGVLCNPDICMPYNLSFYWERDYHNTKPFFIYDWGCLAGDMDFADDGVLHSMLFHSDTELAFACVYNTCYGVGAYASTNSSSAVLQKSFWDYMFNLSKSGSPMNWQLGKAHAWSKDLLAPTVYWRNIDWRGTIECCLLYGDPAQRIKPPIKTEHNIGIQSLDIPKRHLQSNETIIVNTTVFNNGKNSETNVIVSLWANDIKVDSVTIPSLDLLTKEQVRFKWKPSKMGEYTLRVNVTISGAAEEYYDDNEKNQKAIVGIQNIDTNEFFENIQQAIDDVDTVDGHSIVVPPGIYHENVKIAKNITLKGADRETTIIEGLGSLDNEKYVVQIKDVSSMTISGFTIKNAAHYGVYVASALNVNIKNNIISNNIGLRKNGVGIYVTASDSVIISDNEICNNIWGICLTDSSSHNSILDNNIHQNTIIKKPHAISNESEELHSLEIKPVQNINISTAPLDLGGGIKLNNTGNNLVSNNKITKNHMGLTIRSRGANNLIYNNNFDNVRNAYDVGSNNQWDSGYIYGPHPAGGNWWSDYAGNDNNDDGIGDEPYHIPGRNDNMDQYPLMEPDDPPSCIIYVDDDNTNGPWRGTPEHPYQYIQDAVDIAADDDTVLVRNGTYYENLLIYRTINLIGEQKNSTVIDGGGNDDVIYIIARNVTVSGFTIQNSGSFWSCNGIEVHADHSFIYENNIVQNRGGITLESCYNIVSDNIVGDIFYDLFGILIRFSSHNIVINNDITGSGISQFVSFFNIISENTVENGAIYFEGASVNIISGNTVKNSMWGIAVVDTMKNTIIDNTLTSTGIWILSPRFIDGWNTHIIENNTANGKPIRYYKNSDDINIPSNTSQVILANCTNIIIQDCNFSDVNIGIQLGFSSNITIRRNIISGNSYSGIVAEVLSHSIVNENIVEDNNRCGIQLISSFRTFDLFVTHANNIINNTIENHNYGLTLSGINNKVCRNTFSYNIEGIALSGEETNNNTIAENIINNNSGDGISLRWFSNNNTVIWNNITYNDGRGIYLWRSLDNSIHHNNIIGNNQNAYESECSEYFNAWDDEISEGNYWDDFPLNPGYPEVYEIPPDGNNVDNYPLENPI